MRTRVDKVQHYDAVVSSMSGETHNYIIVGSATVPYCRFYNRITKEMWNSTNGEMDAKASIVWAETGVVMIDETASVGGWLYVIPEGLPTGWYDVLVYERAGVSPASTNTQLKGSRVCYIQDGVIISFDNR